MAEENSWTSGEKLPNPMKVALQNLQSASDESKHACAESRAGTTEPPSDAHQCSADVSPEAGAKHGGKSTVPPKDLKAVQAASSEATFLATEEGMEAFGQNGTERDSLLLYIPSFKLGGKLTEDSGAAETDGLVDAGYVLLRVKRRTVFRKQMEAVWTGRFVVPSRIIDVPEKGVEKATPLSVVISTLKECDGGHGRIPLHAFMEDENEEGVSFGFRFSDFYKRPYARVLALTFLFQRGFRHIREIGKENRLREQKERLRGEATATMEDLLADHPKTGSAVLEFACWKWGGKEFRNVLILVERAYAKAPIKPIKWSDGSSSLVADEKCLGLMLSLVQKKVQKKTREKQLAENTAAFAAEKACFATEGAWDFARKNNIRAHSFREPSGDGGRITVADVEAYLNQKLRRT